MAVCDILQRMPFTPLTEAMVASFPAIDIHVHVPGTISPRTAWELGVRNGLLTVYKDASGNFAFRDGPNRIGASDPVKHYSNIFCSKGGFALNLDASGVPIDIDYNYACLGEGHDTFSGFDAIQGTTQGHRHRPGGIQTEDDYRFVLTRYLESCLAQNIRYTEASQNITIAQVLYPTLAPKEGRRRFFLLCQEMVALFAARGVILRFYHCANKTVKANVKETLATRAAEWVSWLEEAKECVPGVFVGMTTAGHEESEIESGGPEAMAQAYHHVAAMGLGVEGHYGEGVGVEHMLKAMHCLPASTRYAHGIQLVESGEALELVRVRGIPLIMMPCINIALGSLIHYQNGTPSPKFEADGKTRRKGVIKKHIRTLEEHPLFTLLREENLAIALASDDPEQAGVSYKAQVRALAGLSYRFPSGFMPLSAEELTLCNLNAIAAAFCPKDIKALLASDIARWMNTHSIRVTHALL